MRALGVRQELTLVALDSATSYDETVVADVDAEALGIHDRPTVPVPPPPFESGVRLGAVVISVVGATLDLVVADMSRDPRSESWRGANLEPDEAAYDPEITPKPAALSIVRALRG
jgi:hypothetical protein